MGDLQDEKTLFSAPQSEPAESVPTVVDASAPLPSFMDSGVVLGDRYEIVAELGRGGIGVVYQAKDRNLDDQLVVVKTLLDESDTDPWLLKKFAHESEALARIKHPGVVKVLDRGRAANGKPFFVMEYLEGNPLRRFIQGKGMEFETVARFLRQMGQALTAAHAEGVVHRDLKPENIIVQQLSGGSEQIKLIDFGIARVLDPHSAQPTTVAMFVGTPEYMAPEQIEFGESSVVSDVYSLGVMAYEMVTGRRPFKLKNRRGFGLRLVKAQREGDFPKPRELRPELAPAAQDLILRALSYQGADRPQQAQEFTDSLADALTVAPKARKITFVPPVAEKRTITVHPWESVPTSLPPPPPPEAESVSHPWESAPTSLPPPLQVAESAAPTSVSPPVPARARWPLLPLAGLGIMILGGILAGLFWGKSPDAPLPGPVQTVQPLPGRKLIYWIEVQKFRNGKPFEKPFIPGIDINYEKDYRVHLNFLSPEPGHLYLFNQGPVESNGLPEFNMMFPTPTANRGTSALAENQRVQVPEQNWIRFDGEAGTETLWLIWSAKPVAELESIREQAVNETTLGVLNPEQVRTVQSHTARYLEAKPELVKDEAKKQTIIKGKGEVIVYPIKLEHH